MGFAVTPKGFPQEQSAGGILKPGEKVGENVALPEDTQPGSVVTSVTLFPSPVSVFSSSICPATLIITSSFVYCSEVLVACEGSYLFSAYWVSFLSRLAAVMVNSSFVVMHVLHSTISCILFSSEAYQMLRNTHFASDDSAL